MKKVYSKLINTSLQRKDSTFLYLKKNSKDFSTGTTASAIVTQGCYSYLQPLSLDDIELQINFLEKEGYAVGLEYTYDPHPRNSYWEMWGKPIFKEEGKRGADDIIFELRELVKCHPNAYQKIVAFDNDKGAESCSSAFLIHRPPKELGYRLHRQECHSRLLRYTIEAKEVLPSGIEEEDWPFHGKSINK